MSISRFRKPLAIVSAAVSMFLIATLLGGCTTYAARSDATQDDPKATPISSVEPRFDDFASKADPIPQREAVASKGDCAPRYRKAGLTGTCIEEKPCRGFGVLENGRAICACYATRGGCAADERCDPRGAQCVKDDDSQSFNRLP